MKAGDVSKSASIKANSVEPDQNVFLTDTNLSEHLK